MPPRITLGDRAFLAFVYTAFLGAILAIALALAAVAASLVTWSWPWNWSHSYPRQVTNITYASATVSPSARTPLIALSQVASSNYPAPVCRSGKTDLFNPNGAVTSQNGAGWSIMFRDAAGVQQSISLPEDQVRVVHYPGKSQEVSFRYSRIVFYYDQLYGSLWTSSPARGPKSTIINCEQALSPAQRMLVGLRYATIFEPPSSMK